MTASENKNLAKLPHKKIFYSCNTKCFKVFLQRYKIKDMNIIMQLYIFFNKKKQEGMKPYQIQTKNKLSIEHIWSQPKIYSLIFFLFFFCFFLRTNLQIPQYFKEETPMCGCRKQLYSLEVFYSFFAQIVFIQRKLFTRQYKNVLCHRKNKAL